MITLGKGPTPLAGLGQEPRPALVGPLKRQTRLLELLGG
jgi:hypothetical protein